MHVQEEASAGQRGHGRRPLALSLGWGELWRGGSSTVIDTMHRTTLPRSP